MKFKEAQAAALKLCRGDYQRNIVLGSARLSGADLKGTAGKYGAHYAASRRALIERIDEAGIPYSIVGGTAHTGPRRFVWGDE